MNPVVWTTQSLQPLVCKHTAGVIVNTMEAFLKEIGKPKSIGFVDAETLAMLALANPPPEHNNVVAICGDTVNTAVTWLAHPWLTHVVSASMLEHPLAEVHLRNLMKTIVSNSSPRLLDWVDPSIVGRRVRLTHASKRVDRLEKMTEFYEGKGVGSRTIELLRDVAEELLTNAFYDAPVSAGALKPISRTEDVALPDDSACDLAYGFRDDLSIVRVRDPFGSLSHRRLIEVLSRCSRTDMQVQVDESMGGAGLGLWRIFSGATFVTVSVVKNSHTEFLVGVAKRAGTGPRPFAFHFFFRESAKRRFWKLADEDTRRASVDHSVLLVSKPK